MLAIAQSDLPTDAFTASQLATISIEENTHRLSISVGSTKMQFSMVNDTDAAVHGSPHHVVCLAFSKSASTWQTIQLPFILFITVAAALAVAFVFSLNWLHRNKSEIFTGGENVGKYRGDALRVFQALWNSPYIFIMSI